MQREVFSVPGRGASPILSPAARIGNIVWTAGHTGRDPKSGDMPDDFEAQTRNTLDGLKAALEAAGSSWDNVLKVNIYLADIAQRNIFNKIYLEYVPTDRPARTCIGNAGFEGNTLVEVECVAVANG